MAINPLIILTLGSLALGLLVWVVFSKLSVERAMRHRVARMRGPNTGRRFSRFIKGDLDASNGLGSVERADKALGSELHPFALRRLMEESGLMWTRRAIALRLVLLSLLVALMMTLFGLHLLTAAEFGVMIAVLFLYLYARRIRKRRFAAFEAELVDALDAIIRGLRSGLPLLDCFGSVAKDAKEPIKSEFFKIMQAHQLGTPLPIAIEQMAQRVPLTEVQFLAILIALQSQAGGSLAEALENLSETLRGRWELSQKVRVSSQEAKSSAMIVGALPFLVAGVLHLMNPDYLLPLVETGVGLTVLIGAGLWMLVGIFVMRQMVNFDV